MISVLYEGLKVFREVIQQNKMKICGRQIMLKAPYEKVNVGTDLSPGAKYTTIEGRPQ